MRVSVTGAGGRLGSALVAALRRAEHDVQGLGRDELDIAEPAAGDRIADWRPDVVVNAAAWTDVDGCARDPDRARRINGAGAELVAIAARRAGASVIQVSTNEVFAGDRDLPYREDDPVRPMNPYGESKRLGEDAVRAANPKHLVVRTAWLFGSDRPDFVTKILAAAQAAAAAARPLRVVSDEWGNPTPIDDLADRLVRVIERTLHAPPTPTLHLCGQPPVSRLEWARHVVRSAGLEVELTPVLRADFERSSTPPRSATLDTQLAESVGLERLGWAAQTARYVDSLRAGSTMGPPR